jgi:hypothetical protein
MATASAASTSPQVAASPTYFACLRGGALSHVGTKAPRCPRGSTRVAWNAKGPRGATGPAGPAGPPGNSIFSAGTTPPTFGQGETGDFYLDTTTHLLYGPAKTTCNHDKPPVCLTAWGTGVSLIGPAGSTGPPGPKGSDATGTNAYVTAADFTDVPGGALTTVITQTVPVAGAYEVMAKVNTRHLHAADYTWFCHLRAANPGGQTVDLDLTQAWGTGLASDSVALEGVVSIAAGGTIWVACEETSDLRDDSVLNAKIISTHLSTFATG